VHTVTPTRSHITITKHKLVEKPHYLTRPLSFLTLITQSLKHILEKYTIINYMYMLSSKIKNVHRADKMTTTRCGIRETATTRNVALEKQPQCEILRCGSYSKDSEGFGLANSEREGDLT
jgi:hypothetical protein